MKRSKSTTSAMNSEDTEDNVRYVEHRLQSMADELEYSNETLDFRTAVVLSLIAILYILHFV